MKTLVIAAIAASALIPTVANAQLHHILRCPPGFHRSIGLRCIPDINYRRRHHRPSVVIPGRPMHRPPVAVTPYKGKQ
jgi:hypothetical protein